MIRTKWMRLIVRDLSDLIRWASQQKARQIDDFRYRVINGRESVSFRLVPEYSIEVGTREIVVICHVRISSWRYVSERAARRLRRLAATIRREPTALPSAGAAVAHNAEIRRLPLGQNTSPSAS